MTWRCLYLLPIVTVLFSTLSQGQQSSPFAPLASWKAAVISGKGSLIRELYSSDPTPRIAVTTKGSADISAGADAAFWAQLHARQLTLNISQSTSPQTGIQHVSFQATIRTAPPARPPHVGVSQFRP